MSKVTIGTVLRKMAEHILETGEAVNVPLDAMVCMVEGRQRQDIGYDEMDDLIAALSKKMNASYVATTINRMKAVIDADKSCRVGFSMDADRNIRVLNLDLKGGSPKKKQIEQASEGAQQRKRGAKLALEKVLAFSPDISEVTPENLGSVQSVVSQYRNFINEMLGVES